MLYVLNPTVVTLLSFLSLLGHNFTSLILLGHTFYSPYLSLAMLYLLNPTWSHFYFSYLSLAMLNLDSLILLGHIFALNS